MLGFVVGFGEILAQVVAHVLRGSHHHGGGWKLRQYGARTATNVVIFSMFGASVLTQMLSCRKQFTAFNAGDFLLVRSVLANGLKLKEKLLH